MKPIDADALGVGKANRDIFNNPAYADGWNDVITIIESAPIIDATPVIRCKDCIHCYETLGGWCCAYGTCVDCIVQPDFYCAFGKRKDGDTP